MSENAMKDERPYGNQDIQKDVTFAVNQEEIKTRQSNRKEIKQQETVEKK